MSEKGIYEFKPTVKINYPGKSESKPGSHGKFLCDKAENGEYLTDKDTYDLKEYFTPAERDSFYGHVKGILQGLEVKYPPSQTVTYKEADTLVNEKTGATYQKLREGGDTLKESTWQKLPKEEQANYKKYTTPEMSYFITGNHYEKDGQSHDRFVLTIKSNNHESIEVNFNKDCQATYIRYNKDNSFVNGKLAPENKWESLDANTKFNSPVLESFAKDLSATVVRSGERTAGKTFPTIYTEVNNYIREHSPKMQNKEGKEVSEYYVTSFGRQGAVIKDNNGETLKNADGSNKTYGNDQFSIMNHSSEKVTFMLTDGDISKVFYNNFASGDKAYSDKGLAGIKDNVSEGFFNIINEALTNYDRGLEATNEEIAKVAADDKDNEFAEYNEQDEVGLPF